MSYFVPFKTWLSKYVKEAKPIGDLARDIMEDKDFPTDAVLRGEVINYLHSKGASSAAIESVKMLMISTK